MKDAEQNHIPCELVGLYRVVDRLQRELDLIRRELERKNGEIHLMRI